MRRAIAVSGLDSPVGRTGGIGGVPDAFAEQLHIVRRDVGSHSVEVNADVEASIAKVDFQWLRPFRRSSGTRRLAPLRRRQGRTGITGT
jgi:hypothetical protein